MASARMSYGCPKARALASATTLAGQREGGSWLASARRPGESEDGEWRARPGRDRHAVVAEERKAGPFERWGQTRDAERAPEGKEGEGDTRGEGECTAREKRT